MEKLLTKMEKPLLFVTENDYDRLSLVKNLESVMTGLSQQISNEINSDIPEPQKDEIESLSLIILKLFKGYDSLPQEKKKAHVAEAIQHVSKLKEIMNIFSKIPENDGQPLKPEDAENAGELLSRPVRSIRGVGPQIATRLGKKSLFTIEDMLYFLPKRYEDRRTICRIPETVPEVRQTILGKIIQADIHFYGKKRIFEVTIDDGYGILKVKWFKGREAFLKGIFKTGRRVILTGEITGFPFERDMVHPDFEVLDENEDTLLHFKRIVPIYSEIEGIHQKTLRRIMWRVVRDYAHLLRSPIPAELSRKHRLMEIGKALHQVHFPDLDQVIDDYQEMRSDAHRSLIYDEFFFFQLGMALRKKGGRIARGI
jgi:ATP-dependent DNA helicase RecG